jgi:YVTN family beta-propeller protein
MSPCAALAAHGVALAAHGVALAAHDAASRASLALCAALAAFSSLAGCSAQGRGDASRDNAATVPPSQPAPSQPAPAAPQAPATPSDGLVPVAFKLAPPNAILIEDGAKLALASGADGVKIARLSLGKHLFVLSAEGYEPRAFRVSAGPKGATAQEKLERSPAPLRLAGMAATGYRPKSVAFTPDGRLIIAPLLSGRGADLIDAATLAKAGRLEPPDSYAKAEGFVESAVVAPLREIWISQMHNSTIHAFDLDTLQYKTSFPSGGSYPKVIAVSPDGSRAYVSNWVSEDVSVIDTATRAVISKIKVGGTPRGLAASSDGAFLYIARFAGGSILRLRLSDGALETLYAADGGAKRHLVLDEARLRLYATDMSRDSLFVLEASTGKLIKEVRLGPNPNTCALSPDGKTIYACTRGTNGAQGYEKEGPDPGELIAVDAESLEVVARQWGGDQPTGLAVSPDGARVVFSDFLDARLEAYDILAR